MELNNHRHRDTGRVCTKSKQHFLHFDKPYFRVVCVWFPPSEVKRFKLVFLVTQRLGQSAFFPLFFNKRQDLICSSSYVMFLKCEKCVSIHIVQNIALYNCLKNHLMRTRTFLRYFLNTGFRYIFFLFLFFFF